MSSVRENFEHNQLIWRRREAYDQHHALEEELKTLRSQLHDLDKKIEQNHPDQIAEVQFEMGRIGFIQTELDNLSDETMEFAKNELAIRFEKLFEKLRTMTKVGGAPWADREAKTIRLYDVQQAVIKKQDEISNLDHAYFSTIEYQASNPVTPPPPVDDDVFEKWIEESQLTEKEIYEYDREAWHHEKTWAAINDESQKRAIAELQEQKISADEFEQRMKAALKLETEIENVRQQLQRKVQLLQRAQDKRKKAIEGRITLQDTINSKTREYNSRIKYLEDFFDMSIPSGIWPDYIIGKTSEAYDPGIAEQLLIDIKETMDAEEQKEFWLHQAELKQLREDNRKFNEEAHQRINKLEKDMDDGLNEEELLRQDVIRLRDELNVKNGMRAAELQVALPRIKVLGEDGLELDPPKFARTPERGTLPPGYMGWTALDQSATVPVEGVAAKGATGEVKEASASITVGFNAEAKAEVYQKKQDNDAGEEKVQESLRSVGNEDAYIKEIQRLTAIQMIKFDPDYKADDDDPEAKKTRQFKDAVDQLNAQHSQEKLVNQVIEFKVTGNAEKVQHMKEMLAFRCGFNLHKDKTITCKIVSRYEHTGNTLHVFFPKSQTMGLISVYPMPSGDWKIATAKNIFPDWVNYSKRHPEVPPMAKNSNHTIPEYLQFYRLIQASIDTFLAAEQKKKATG